jgi:hypothetical protein
LRGTSETRRDFLHLGALFGLCEALAKLFWFDIRLDMNFNLYWPVVAGSVAASFVGHLLIALAMAPALRNRPVLFLLPPLVAHLVWTAVGLQVWQRLGASPEILIFGP